MRRQKLSNMSDLRRFMSKVINDIDEGVVDPATGRTLAYCCSILKGIIEVSDLETRVDALEKKIEGKSRCHSKTESTRLKSV